MMVRKFMFDIEKMGDLERMERESEVEKVEETNVFGTRREGRKCDRKKE